MASCSLSDPIGETWEVQVRWSDDPRWYTEENGKGTEDQAKSWANELLEANDEIEIRLVKVERTLVLSWKKPQPVLATRHV